MGYDGYGSKGRILHRSKPINQQRPGLMEMALAVFGTTDGIRPLFPRSGEKIQEALEKAFDLGRSSNQ